MGDDQCTDDEGISALINSQTPIVDFRLLDELYGIKQEDAGRFTPPGGAERLKQGDISGSDLERASIKHTRFSHEIATTVVEGKQASLEAITLFIFDGPSIDEVEVKKHVRTWMNVEPYEVYGKLSLRPPHKRYRKIQEVTGQIVQAVLEIMGFLFVHNLYLAVRAIKEKRETSQRNWELVFDKTGRYEGSSLSVGEGSFIAMKCLARSSEARRMYKHFTRQSGIKLDTILGTKLKRPISEYPLIYARTRYLIPYENVDEMLHQGSNIAGDPKGHQKIILFTGIEADPIRPNIKDTGHWIYAITKISGVDTLYVSSLGFHGPEFYVRQTANTSYFPK